MAKQTTVRAISAHSDGTPLIGEVREFKAPAFKKLTEDVKDGHFLQGKRVNGYKLEDWGFKAVGMSPDMLAQVAIGGASQYMLTFKESCEDQTGRKFSRVHTIGGEITSVNKDAVKTGDEDVWNYEGYADTYKMVSDGQTIYEFNTDTQKTVIDGVDKMSEHMNNVR